MCFGVPVADSGLTFGCTTNRDTRGADSTISAYCPRHALDFSGDCLASLPDFFKHKFKPLRKIFPTINNADVNAC
jgi:hypothetical protein